MSEHFIKNIEIKNFKCFKDFKAEGFKRVNLIGGKNNVGKTAFMEVCYLGINTKSQKEFFHALLVLELNRNPLKEFKIITDTNDFDFKFYDSVIKINGENASIAEINLYNKPNKNYLDGGVPEIMEFYQGKTKPLNIENSSFVSQVNLRENYLINCIGEIKLLQKWRYLNKILLENFDIEEIDVIKNKILLFKDEKFINLSEFGDGVKQFIAVILSLFLNKNKIVFLDEIENGIHYSLLDSLWEIILTISKEQNIQVFATTHSEECIESYMKVAKKLQDEEITFIGLNKLKNKTIKASIRDYELLEYNIEQVHEVRGW